MALKPRNTLLAALLLFVPGLLFLLFLFNKWYRTRPPEVGSRPYVVLAPGTPQADTLYAVQQTTQPLPGDSLRLIWLAELPEYELELTLQMPRRKLKRWDQLALAQPSDGGYYGFSVTLRAPALPATTPPASLSLGQAYTPEPCWYGVLRYAAPAGDQATLVWGGLPVPLPPK